MRRRLIAKEVEYYYNLLKVEKKQENNYIVITNWDKISTALYKLNEFDFIGDSIQKIFDMGAAYMSSQKSISIPNNDYARFDLYLNYTKAKCEAIITLYSNMVDAENNLYIKLPNDLHDLNTLSDIVSKLDLVFNKCPIFSEKIGNVTFTRVEEGSSWLVFVFATSAVTKGLDWIAKFVKTCCEIRNLNETYKGLKLENALKKIQIESKDREDLLKKFKEAKQKELKEMCLNMFADINTDKNEIKPEEESRIVHCMLEMAELLDLGIEIYPSSDASEEIKNIFPKREEQKYLPKSQELLTNKTED